MRIAVGSVVHEANTFMPARISWEDIQSGTVLRGAELLDPARALDTAIPGFLRLPDVEWLPLVSIAIPGGAGKLTIDAFHHIRDEFTRRVRGSGALDACLLSIGGGMVADRDDLEDADGELLTAIRTALPAGCRLGVALDMHANVTDRMVAAADVMLAFQTFPPHWDKADVGEEIARLVHRAVLGEVEPVIALARPPLLLQPEGQDTQRSPMREVMAAARTAAKQPGILATSMVAGFAWCDVPEAGTSVLVIADRDRALAQSVADDLAERWFAMRDGFRFPLVPIEQAAARAAAHSGLRPLMLCDHADNPGAGGGGDSTDLLAALLVAGVANAGYATLCDPSAVAAAVDAGIDGELEVDLGGRRDPVHSRPLHARARVRHLSDGRYRNQGPLWPAASGNLGRTATLAIGGVEVVVTERANGAFDPAVFRCAGIEPLAKSVLVVKSQIFAPKAYAGLIEDAVIVDGEGWATSNFRRLPYTRVRRPIFPLDSDVEFLK